MTRHVRWIAALVVLAAGSALALPAAGEIVLRQKYPTQGNETQVFVQDDGGAPVSGAKVTVTYRPGSSVEETLEIGVTGAGGRLEWTPSAAGIATLNAHWEGGSTSTNVSVKFAGIPAGGLIIMILAGLLLLGGSVVRIARVLRSAD